jgi:hypothetical protein
MVLTLVYPAAADNNFKKYYVCYRLQQKLQDVYNTWGQKHKNEEITDEEWEQFRTEWYKPRRDLTVNEILRIRELAKNHNWNINLNNIFIEV